MWSAVLLACSLLVTAQPQRHDVSFVDFLVKSDRETSHTHDKERRSFWSILANIDVFSTHTEKCLVDVNSEQCTVPPGSTVAELRTILKANCDYVDAADRYFGFIASDSNNWGKRLSHAKSLCADEGNEKVKIHNRTQNALNAWGTLLMCRRECCNAAMPPYCASTWKSKVGHILPAIVCLFLVICVYFVPVTPLGKRFGIAGPRLWMTEDKSPVGSSVDGPIEKTKDQVKRNADGVKKEMSSIWDRASLHKLHLSKKPDFKSMAVDTFSSLTTKFDFQEDSCLNQFEHFISMWRSNCAMVADEQLQGEGDVFSGDLLEEGLEALHEELLDGLQRWRRRFGFDLEAQTSKARLREIATYLLVWGEAGNIRFMPELLCFIVDSAIAATNNSAPLYGSNNASQSNKFLAFVIRPAYSVVFDAHYFQVTTAGNNKDAKQLLQDFEKYLPADVPNHDDWNELFNDPIELQTRLVLQNDEESGRRAEKLFDLDHGKRFAELHRVDWAGSLKGAKTHREIHSLWGLFASTHRAIFLHVLMFLLSMFAVARHDLPDLVPTGDRIWLAGSTEGTCLATIGLVVPIHAFFVKMARWIVSGTMRRQKHLRNLCFFGCRVITNMMFWILPFLTYALIRYFEYAGDDKLQNVGLSLRFVVLVHFFICLFQAAILLFVPHYEEDAIWKLTPTPWTSLLVRWSFWIVVLGVKATVSQTVITAMYTNIKDLNMTLPGQTPVGDLPRYAFSPVWDKDMLQWVCMWGTCGLLYFTDTQFWSVLGCAVLGFLVAAWQRMTSPLHILGLENSFAAIPKRFSRMVLWYDCDDAHQMHWAFPNVWDKVVQFMRYEDKIDDEMFKSMAYLERHTKVDWKNLKNVDITEFSNATPIQPGVFMDVGGIERMCRRTIGVCDDGNWPENAEIQWRLCALSRAMTFKLPRPFRFPHMPGLTVLIPHYGESIYMPWEGDGGLVAKGAEVQLMDWVKYRYGQEFKNFLSHQSSKESFPQLPSWEMYGDTSYAKAKDSLIAWASMRNQTLYRTVAGMTLYHQALECHKQIKVRASGNSDNVPEISECFRCLITMQMYRFFGKKEYQHVNMMLSKFPESLKIAYIDFEDVSHRGCADRDGVHPRQARRYYSCLIDGDMPKDSHDDTPRKSKYRIELPGYPILGDGKGDNQNHAIPFTRGTFIQMIDANQGAYFEQMMMLPNVFGEFRNEGKGKHAARKIVGFPEHITSDVGSIGDFAAGAETAFGTILQRVYSVLGGRMHYGHPDMMNKAFIMQQGGVSKATKTVNLSEDIFAGMDFTLRGGGTIQHTEYFNLAKGRDLGFNAVLGFFSKISSGTGEQILTRQMFRLGQVMGLPEFLMFYYAHAGYYLAQCYMSMGLPMIMFIWLLVILDTDSDSDRGFSQEVMATLLSIMFSSLLFLFIAGQSAPLIVEMWTQFGFVPAFMRLLKQMVTLSPLHFIFQAKIIGNYVSNEIRYGGATYVATGRGLPNERKRFIGWQDEVEFRFYRLVVTEARGKAAVLAKFRNLQFFYGLDKDGNKLVQMPALAQEELQCNLGEGVVIDFGKGRKGKMTGYTFTTSSGSESYDPVRWQLEGSNDEAQLKWNVVHSAMYGPTLVRNAEIGAIFPVVKGAKKDKGGLYNDYAYHAHHDGAKLLGAFLVVVLAGGLDVSDGLYNSLMWIVFVVALTVISWLYTPYIFNPYQFFYQEWWDFRHWRDFFFADGGRQWYEWYQETQVKPMHGVRATPLDVMYWLLFVFSWYTVLQSKAHLFTVIWDSKILIVITQFLITTPPLILTFTFVLPLWSFLWPGEPGASYVGFSDGYACGCIPKTVGTARSITYKHYRFIPTRLRKGKENIVKVDEFVVFESGREIANQHYPESEWSLKDVQSQKLIGIDFEEPTRIDRYSFRTSNGSADHDPICWKVEGSNDGESWVTLHENKLEALCPAGFRGLRIEPQLWHELPPNGLVFAAFVMIIVEVIEGAVCLSPLYFFGSSWIKIFISGALLKYTGLSLMLFGTECLFRCRGKVPQTAGVMPVMVFKRGLKLWYCAHRMAADIAVSFLIVSVLSMFVVYDFAVRRVCGCTGSSVHQLLVFRDPGHAKQTTVEVPMAPKAPEIVEMTSGSSRSRLGQASKMFSRTRDDID